MTTAAIKFIMNVNFAGETKMMSFLPGMLASEIYAEIEQKFRKEGHDHVLFLPRLKKYLNPDQKLAEYEPGEEELIIFRSRFVHYKVKMLDDSVRTFTLDDMQTVNEHIRAIGRKLRIRHYREFVLTKENSEDWLDAKMTLPELDITAEDTLVFKKVYYVYDNNVTKNDGAEVHILYEQTMQSFIGGGLPVVKTDALLLAAYALQERNSDFEAATKFE
jgi:talin